MRLLLDIHHSPRAAQRLRDKKYDVIAGVESASLRDLDDEELLHHATSQGRALVSEDVKEFDRIAKPWSVSGQHHAGLILTSARRYDRKAKSYPNDLVRALERLLEVETGPTTDRVWWL